MVESLFLTQRLGLSNQNETCYQPVSSCLKDERMGNGYSWSCSTIDLLIGVLSGYVQNVNIGAGLPL